MSKSQLLIKDAAALREDVLTGEIFGFIRLYKALDEKEKEGSLEYILSITYPSYEIKNLLQAISQKLQRKRAQGTFILTGGYGTGKSHILLLLYHLFKNPKFGEDWLKRNGMNIKLPDSKIILLPLMDMSITLLWEPILKELGKENLLKSVKLYPTTSVIKKALEGSAVVLIIDELEAWYNAIDNEAVRNKNLNFLQNLTEVAKEKSSKLLIFSSLYGWNQELMGRIGRVNPYLSNLATSAERPKILLFRLFENIDGDKARGITEAYLKQYKHVDLSLGDIQDYKTKLLDYYPIHPELINVLFERYSSSKNYQNTRGVLYLLSSTLKREHERKDLLLASDVDAEAEDELLQLDRELVEKCITDIRKSRVTLGKEILNTILLYSLGGVKDKGATEQEIALGVIRPNYNINELYASLAELKTKAWYLWKSNGRYLIKPEENVLVVIQAEAERALEEGKTEEAIKKIKEILKKDRSFNVYHPAIEEEIPDDKEIKIAVSLKHVDAEELNDFYKGRKYRNTIIFIIPKRKVDLTKEESLLITAQRIAICEAKKEEVTAEKRSTVIDLLRKDKGELSERLAEIYGNWMKTIQAEKGKVEYRQVACQLSEMKAKVKASYDVEAIKQDILDSLEGKEKGIRAGEVLEDFYTILGKPVIFSSVLFEDAVFDLLKEGKIVIEKGAKVYDEKEKPSRFDKEAMTLKLKKYHRPAVEVVEVEKKKKKEGPISGEEEESYIAPPSEVIGVTTLPKLIEIETGEFKTPYALIGELERKISAKDELKSANIIIKSKFLSFEELEAFVRELKIKGAKFDITVDVSLESEQSNLISLIDKFPPPQEGTIKAKITIKKGKPQ